MSALALIAIVSVTSMAVTQGDSHIVLDGRRYTSREIFADRMVSRLADAVSSGRIEEVDRLIASGADPNYVGRFEYTPAMWAIQTNSLRGYELLIKRGAKLDLPNNTTLSAMGLAAGPARNSKFLKIALLYGGNPDTVDIATSEPVLFQAIKSGEEDRVAMLINAGADINKKAKCDITPLMEAAFNHEYHSAFLLLRAGADFRTRNCNGTDFETLVRRDQFRPWWMPGYWWRQKILNYLAEMAVAPNNAEMPTTKN